MAKFCNDAAVISSLGKADFTHVRRKTLLQHMTPYEAYVKMASTSGPVLRGAFWLRDVLGTTFNLRKIHGFSEQYSMTPPLVGDMLDFFKVEDISPNVLKLSANDHHLTVSVALHISDEGTVEQIANVWCHNWVGRLYMVPVSPAHSIIVAAMLGRL